MKNDILNKLENWGCDVKSALIRCVDDEEFYIDCLKNFACDDCFEKLNVALQEKNFTQAFEFAHSLKGVAGNLGLTPIYNLLYVLVEKLRSNQYDDVKTLYGEVEVNFNKFCELVK